jgi:hypothetical protein
MDVGGSCWAVFFGVDGYVWAQFVGLTPPAETAEEYAQRRLTTLLVAFLDPGMPQPPAGKVACGIYTDDDGIPGRLLGRADGVLTDTKDDL